MNEFNNQWPSMLTASAFLVIALVILWRSYDNSQDAKETQKCLKEIKQLLLEKKDDESENKSKL